MEATKTRFSDNSPRTELFERRPNDSLMTDHAVSSRFHIGQITANYSTGLYDYFAIEYNVLWST